MNKLANFYDDNAYNINDFKLFLKTDDEVWQELIDYSDQLNRNQVLGKIETYRIFPINIIPCAPAVYDVGVVMSVPEVATYLELTHLTVEERVPYWDTYAINDERKIKALDLAGFYIEFLSVTVYPYNGYPEPLRFNVVGMDLYLGEDKLQLGVDYEIRNNRLYLLSSKAATTLNSGRSFVAYDIAVDYNTVSRYYGDNFKLPQYPDMSKDVYNDILQKIVKSALGGPTIKSIRSGLSAIVDGADVYDLISATDEHKVMWKTKDLTPFDFVIEIPAEKATSTTMADVIKRYIDVVKPAQSTYVILLKSSYEEVYSRHQKASYTALCIITDDTLANRTEVYRYSSVNSLTNDAEYVLNDNFMTQDTHGAHTQEEAASTLINVETGEETHYKY